MEKEIQPVNMRILKYRDPVKVTSTVVATAFLLNEPAKCYYERALAITTKFGICLAYDFNWKTNAGTECWTQYETVINGYKYYATIDASRLSDRQLKWLATNFMKTLNSKICIQNQK